MKPTNIFPILTLELRLDSFYSANPSGIEADPFEELDEYISSLQGIFTLQRYSHQLADIKNHLYTNKINLEQQTFFTQLLEKLLNKVKEDQYSLRKGIISTM